MLQDRIPSKVKRLLDVDVIIPTFNSGKVLDLCLSSIRKQQYNGKIGITIIDGGSTDGTLQIAQNYNARTIVMKGMYGTGLNGARHYGETITSSPLVWNVDSDNFIVEDDALLHLVQPFLDDANIHISIPETAIDSSASSLNNWIALQEIEKVNKMKAKSRLVNGYLVIDDMFYGLTNCALLKRSSLEMAGGYDSDVRLLWRLRKLGLSKGAIVGKSHFYHNQIDSAGDLYRKLVRRFRKFANMTTEELKMYFYDYPPPVELDSALKTGPLIDMMSGPILSMKKYIETNNKTWAYGGAIYPLIIVLTLSIHPVATYKTFIRFL